MIQDFAYRKPAAAGVVIFGIFFVIPGILIAAMNLLFPEQGVEMGIRILSVYAFVLELVLLFNVDSPIMVMEPVIVSLVGFVAVEIVYFMAQSVSRNGYIEHEFVLAVISQGLVTITESGVAALLVYWAFLGVRKLVTYLRNRRV